MLPIHTTLSLATRYSFLVFAAGALCGIIRVPFLEPILGKRLAQLVEMPVMFFAIKYSAKFLLRLLSVRGKEAKKESTNDLVIIGSIALLEMLILEFVLAAFLRGSYSFSAFFREMDAVAGPVYIAMLAVFAFMPAGLVVMSIEHAAAEMSL